MNLPVKEDFSQIEIAEIYDKSVLVTSKILKPLKVFPLYNKKVCQIVFSNYGGGFVGGDQVNINIHLNQNSCAVFTSQANTRIYKSLDNVITRQNIKGKIEAGAFGVMLGDPVIPHQGSIFEQLSHWEVDPEAVLLVVDWFEAGRLLNQERFAFQSFFSEMKIDMNDAPIVWDKFQICPTSSNFNSPAAFLDHSCYLNLFLIGNNKSNKVMLLNHHLNVLAKSFFHEDHPLLIEHAGMIGTWMQVSDQVSLLRCSARTHEMIALLVKELAQHLSDAGLLGFNPIERKF